MSEIISLSHKYGLHKVSIEDIQNISIFTIAVSTFLSYLYYNIHYVLYNNEQGRVMYDMLTPIIGFHALTDFFLTKSYDLKLHHLFVIGFYFYNYHVNVSIEDNFIFIYPLLNTEISSVFYVLKYWLPKNSFFYSMNSILFYISFFKLRIIDYYYKILYNHSPFEIVFQKYPQSNYYLSSILFISSYGLYILNLYWFLIINKVLYKNIIQFININNDTICHLLCSYSQWINIPVAFYIYSQHSHEKNIFDMTGIIMICVSSYIYHIDIYKRLQQKQITEYELPSKDNIILFLNDAIFINIRSFLVVTTNYYNNKHLLSVLFTSGCFHVCSLYFCILNIFDLFIIDYETNKLIFSKCHTIYTMIPIIYDILLVYSNSPNEVAVPFLLTNCVIALLFLVNPFYKLNHVAFHIGLIIQNYYMCTSNANSSLI
jgi:hypothetical protein